MSQENEVSGNGASTSIDFYAGPQAGEGTEIKMEVEDKTEKKSKKKREEGNAFLEELQRTQLQKAHSALLETLVKKAEMPIGDIIDALENDGSGGFAMNTLFRRMTLSEIADELNRSSRKSKVASGSLESSAVDVDMVEVGGDDEEFEDDDEFTDDGSLEAAEEDEEVEAAPKPRRRKKKPAPKAKASAGPRKTNKKSTSATASGGDASANRKLVLTILKDLKARNAGSAVSSREIQEASDGQLDAAAIRTAVKVLRDSGKVDSEGEARGTKYFRVRQTA